MLLHDPTSFVCEIKYGDVYVRLLLYFTPGCVCFRAYSSTRMIYQMCALYFRFVFVGSFDFICRISVRSWIQIKSLRLAAAAVFGGRLGFRETFVFRLLYRPELYRVYVVAERS